MAYSRATMTELASAAEIHGWTRENRATEGRQVFTRGTEQVTVFYGSRGQLTEVHVGETGGAYGLMVGNLKRERTRKILRSKPGAFAKSGARSARNELVEQIAKRALDGISQTLTLPEVGLMERTADGSVYFEVYTPNHGTFRVLVTAT